MVKFKYTVHSFEEAEELLGNKAQLKIAHNTYLVQSTQFNCPVIHIRFHNTNVVTYYPYGDVNLDNGGWDTITTRDRIKQNLPLGWNFFRKQGKNYLSRGFEEPFEVDLPILIEIAR